MQRPPLAPWLRAFLALSLLLAACAPRQTVREPEPIVEPPPDPEPEPEPERWGVAFEDIGWDTVPAEPSERAFRANTEGWKLHQSGNWAASRASFAEAVSAYADYDLARYNLACAYSRLGQIEPALQALTAVLVRDLPRFKRRSREDPDLANLRRAASDELDWRIDRIDDAWEQAMRVGTPTVAWRAPTRTAIAAAQDKQGQLLRPGVWVDEIRRFVPAMELYEGVHSAFVDVERQQAMLVTAGRTTDVPPRFEAARLYVTRLTPVGDDQRDVPLTYDALETIEVHAVSAGARVRLNRHKTAWRELRAAGLVREGQELPDRPVMLMTPDGSLLVSPLPDGWSIKNRTVTLPDGATVGVQSVHSIANFRSVVRNADQTWAVVVGVRFKCTKEGPVLRHGADRIDLSNHRATALSDDDGAAAAYFGRDGALYLQVDDTTQRYADPASDRFETLPDGVLLTPPMDRPTCK